jgi:DNA-3-methyladenine glycosylase II|tara:strand:+ start:1872 stop:2576 length:705 start_codon:yes stop_codon:yes gene_type:complete
VRLSARDFLASGGDISGKMKRRDAPLVGRIIQTPDCVAEGAAYLARIEPRFADALAQTGPLPLRRRRDGFEALLDAIVSQQVSVAAAAAIWGRMKAAKLTGPRKVIRASDEELRACGLSRQKIRYARALAAARIDFRALRDVPTPEVIATLVEVPGIGRWTAEIYAMFSLGRADVFAPGDLALQEAAKLLFDLEARPRERELRVMAEAWAPWRGVAARALWAYYRVAKDREGIR